MGICNPNRDTEESSKHISGKPIENTLQKKGAKDQIGLDDFNMVKVVGRGSFGKVILVKKKDTGRPYAMKTLSKEMIARRNQKMHTKSKLRVMAKRREKSLARSSPTSSSSFSTPSKPPANSTS